jgi:hypothetical protein
MLFPIFRCKIHISKSQLIVVWNSKFSCANRFKWFVSNISIRSWIWFFPIWLNINFCACCYTCELSLLISSVIISGKSFSIYFVYFFSKFGICTPSSKLSNTSWYWCCTVSCIYNISKTNLCLSNTMRIVFVAVVVICSLTVCGSAGSSSYYKVTLNLSIYRATPSIGCVSAKICIYLSAFTCNYSSMWRFFIKFTVIIISFYNIINIWR